MKPSPELLAGLGERFEHAVIVFVDGEGYPLSVATDFRADPDRGVVALDAVAGDEVQPPLGEQVNVVFSHIRPQPGIGYDERRYVSLWGKLERADGGDELVLTPDRALGWDEEEVPFFEYSERSVPQARRYFEQVSAETGRDVRPKLSFGWLFLRATRLPFLSATFVPILLGIAVAAFNNGFNWWLALLTLVGGAAIHLGVNVFNDVFDTQSGADEANVNPTQFSGGSRVILYGLVSMRRMALAGVRVLRRRDRHRRAPRRAARLGPGVAGRRRRADRVLLHRAAASTRAPRARRGRGCGRLRADHGARRLLRAGARVRARAALASIPVAILIALILYVNEVPDRPGDAASGKRTLPVRWSKEAVIRGYEVAVVVTFGLIVVFAVTGLIVRPTLIALLAAPLALPVVRALRESYDQPYALMPAMGKNIQLHLVTGLLLVIGYVIAIIADAALDDPPFFLQ